MIITHCTIKNSQQMHIRKTGKMFYLLVNRSLYW